MRSLGAILCILALVATLVIVCTPSTSGANVSVSELEKAITRCEKVITRATEMYEQGKIAKGKPIKFRITPTLSMKVSRENFTQDVDKIWDVYYKLVTARKRMASPQKVSQPRVVKKKKRSVSRIEAMRREEEKSAALSPDPVASGPVDFDIYQDYQASRQQRISAESQAAEADIRSVIAERQAADIQEQQRMSRKGQLQAQASMWQAELDKQASGSAKAAAAWNAERSAGGYARRFFGTVIQTTVGAFTGGLFGTLGYNAANKAVDQLFPAQSNLSSSQFQQGGSSNSSYSGQGGAGNGNPQY
ncbi:hypothetical protein MNBD_NITROSPINAE02-371 [hydrothermal vent metagenome]|uniref:Uncharacterized protein n=1 Tax=hydrothermal vent metagenome TaxID=652676 RepID=A0A3B1CIG2_9ZZZZ